MEGVSEMGWSPSFNYTTMPVEESDFVIAQLLGGCEQDAEMSFSVPSLFCSDLVNTDYTNYLNSQDANASFCGCWPQESFNVNASSSLFSLPMDTGSMNVVGSAMNCNTEQLTFSGCFRSQEDTSTEAFGDSGTNSVKTGLNERLMHKRKFSMVEVNMNADNDDNKINANAFDDSKKKAKVTSQIQKGSKKQKLRNTLQKSIRSSGEEEDRSNVQSSDCCSSEDESNASQELNRGRSPSSSSKGSPALNLNGKTRATRGSATDPQSLYARKRRERINERLRTLQNLVPNGTKVDISTMLEAAVQYVKFLQLQIKLLSSDELWMYAPLAYNGMEIGL